MKYRATIGLTIDISSEREMGLEIDDSGIEEYVIENMIEFIHSLMINNDLDSMIEVKEVKE